MLVAVIKSDKRRSKIVAGAMVEGIARSGDEPVLIKDRYFEDSDRWSIAVFYGMAGRLREIYNRFRRPGRKAVHVDMGYFGRTEGGTYKGFHKVVVNDRHPTDYFQMLPHPQDRINRFNVKLKPYETGSHVLVPGMSGKGALFEGYQPEQWERETIAEIRKHTDRPIVYRPKPNWTLSKPIEGAIYSTKRPVEADLAGCHAVVCHHSNTAIEALIAGVPVFCKYGVATRMGLQDLSQIEDPIYPENRQQFLNDIAYTQYNIDEMKTGLPWTYLKSEGLI